MIAPGQTLKPLVRLPKDANACWLWQGGTNGSSTPVKSFDGGNISARRWMWQTLFGTLPKEFDVTTSCGEALCVNPAHLRAATRAEVTQDRLSGLTASDVADIKRLANDGGVFYDILAKRFDVHPETIRKIAKGKRWVRKEARVA